MTDGSGSLKVTFLDLRTAPPSFGRWKSYDLTKEFEVAWSTNPMSPAPSKPRSLDKIPSERARFCGVSENLSNACSSLTR